MPAQPTETTSLRAATPWFGSSFIAGLLCTTLIVLSVILIIFNRWLMKEGHFPHALPLVLIHMIFSCVFGGTLRVLKPSLFPSLTDPDMRLDLDVKLILMSYMPMGLLFASGLVLGNVAYNHLGVAFIQMIKESNLVFVYALTVICAMERCTSLKTSVIIVAIVGMTMSVRGELDLRITGVVIQTTAVLCEAFRVIMQASLLQGKKVDPLSHVLISAPCCGILLLLVLVVSTFTLKGGGDVSENLALPSWSSLGRMAPQLLATSILAFSLNLCIAATIKFTGPMSYLMCQIMKDIVLVITSTIFLGDNITTLQLFGFIVQCLAVFTWSWLKTMPTLFESDLRALPNAFLEAFGKKGAEGKLEEARMNNSSSRNEDNTKSMIKA